MKNMSSNEKFDALPQALKDVVMHPEFQSVVADIQSLPASERSQAVVTQLTPKALAARGIQFPEEFAIAIPAQEEENITHASHEVKCDFCITDRAGHRIYCYPPGCV